MDGKPREADMTHLLKRINSVSESRIKEEYVVLNLEGGIFSIKKQSFSEFQNQWTRCKQRLPLSVDLASTLSHAVILDYDHVGESLNLEEALVAIEQNLRLLLLPHVVHFTYLVAMRAESRGIHVHLPEFSIGYDDYVLLCGRMQKMMQPPGYKLDILTNMLLPGVGKPPNVGDAYSPIRMTYVDECRTTSLSLNGRGLVGLDVQRKSFKRVKANSDSVFRKILFFNESQMTQLIFKLLMPVVTEFPYRARLSFSTTVHEKPNESVNADDVAVFTYLCDPDKRGYLCKGRDLLFDGSHFLKAFHYMDAAALDSVETDNHALNIWYRRIRSDSRVDEGHPFFSRINRLLRMDNVKFSQDANPIKTIMEYEDGYYFLPVFYALVNVLPNEVDEIIAHLKGMLSDRFAGLFEKLEKLNKRFFVEMTKDLTLNTVFFCGNNMYESDRPKDFRFKLKCVVKDSAKSIMSVTNVQQMEELLRKLQERHFPIKTLRLNNSMKKAEAYVWNALSESWQELTSDKLRHDHMQNLWSNVRAYVKEYHAKGGDGGPDNDLLNNLHLPSVIASLSSDSAMEVKHILMDQHKWLLRMQDGSLLDLLTGHVGGTVPELYMSHRTFDVRVSRKEMLLYFDDACPLSRLYSHLMSRRFFLRYLKELFLDKTDDLFDTAREIVIEETRPDVFDDPNALSMLHFYVHFCKYVAFEYRYLVYLMDVLTSTLIATNYKRKFFVCKGETSNGKSMLFEIIGRVFGRYYVSIQSDNLKSGKGGGSGNPSPDLALTLFTCRIVAMEELEGKVCENRVKQITGLSRVSFRALYEVSQSAIPTAKVFATTNNLPECTATQAFRERVVALPFNSKFVERPPAKTSEQVRECLYPKDEHVVEQSYVGCFLMLFYHLKAHMNLKDGLIHYRDPPIVVEEYTEEYLSNTDVYAQFKIHMDVQKIPGGVTTTTDVESAIRQYLNATKTQNTLETELRIKFEEEFGEFRKTDLQLESGGFSSILKSYRDAPLKPRNPALELEREEEPEDKPPPAKKSKSSAAVYYEDVVIKNLKKNSSLFDN